MELENRKSIAPLDIHLGIDNLPFKMTKLAMLEIAFWGQNQTSFQRASDILNKKCGININYETIRLVTSYVGSMVFEEDCRKAECAYSKLNNGGLTLECNKKGVLYIQTDGAQLNTRTKDKSGSTWRENKLGEVFSSDNIRYWTDKKGKKQHQITKKEYISYVGSVSEFKKHLLACAVRGGYGSYEKTVVLGDGAAWIRNMVKELFHGAQQILDFFHMSENVNIYARHLFNHNEKLYLPWVDDVCKALKQGEYKRILLELEKYKEKTFKNCSINLYNYINSNIDNIDYKDYEEQGYFIGSGAIESGNKIILQQRLKQAGMRWNVTTAQPVLTLRTKWESERWDSDVVNFILN